MTATTRFPTARSLAAVALTWHRVGDLSPEDQITMDVWDALEDATTAERTALARHIATETSEAIIRDAQIAGEPPTWSA